MARPRSSPKPRHVRQHPRCCLIRIERDGRQIGAVGQLDPTGRIVSSNIATITGDPATYWRQLRALLPADAIVMASIVPRYLDIAEIDFESSIFRTVKGNGRLAAVSARGRRELLTMRATRAAANRAARAGRPRPERTGLHWGYKAKFFQTHAVEAAA